MLELSAKIRSEEKKAKSLRREGSLPGIVYGYQTENLSIEMDPVEFTKIYYEAGESTLVKINLTDEEGKKVKKSPTVLIQDTQEDPISDEFTHVDFYQPNLKEKVEVQIPLYFVGDSPVVKSEDGTLVRNLSEVTIEALPESLIHDIEVDISVLETFDDVIKVADLKVPDGVEIIEEEDKVVALVSRPQDIEEELEEPLDEDLEGIEVIGEKEEDEEGSEEGEKEDDNEKKEE